MDFEELINVRVQETYNLFFRVILFNFSSGGRDQVIHVWDLETGTTIKTIPVFEVNY